MILAWKWKEKFKCFENYESDPLKDFIMGGESEQVVLLMHVLSALGIL